MRIHAAINERTLRRSFREQLKGSRGLVVLDNDLKGFALKVSPKGKRTFVVRVARKLGVVETVLGTADRLTAAEAREKAAAVIEAARTEREHGPLFGDFADEFMRRRGRCWKPATREGNALLLRRYLVPFFGATRVADIARADVQRWFDSMSGTPGNANRGLPVLSVMMRQAELWDLRPQGSNPCRNMRRYRLKPRERFLSADELKRLGFVLDHAEDRLAAAPSGCCCSPARGPRRLRGCGGSGYAAPARCSPIRRPGRRRFSLRRPREPFSMACRAPAHSSSRTATATGR